MKNLYTLYLSNSKQNSCKIECNNDVIDFDLSTIIADLLACVTFENRAKNYLMNYDFVENYDSHPFLNNDVVRQQIEFHKSVPNRSIDPFRFSDFENDAIININKLLISIEILGEIAVNKKIHSLSDFELMKSLSSMNFTFDVQTCVNNEFVDNEFFVDFDIYNHILELENNYDQVRYVYKCNNIEEVVYATYHFLIFFNYKFSNCKHCNQLFTTKTLNQKYCTRKSPLEKYKNVDCKTAVENANKFVRRNYKKYYDKFYHNASTDIISGYMDDYKDIKDKHVNLSSFEFFNEMIHFFDKNNIRNNYISKYAKRT